MGTAENAATTFSGQLPENVHRASFAPSQGFATINENLLPNPPETSGGPSDIVEFTNMRALMTGLARAMNLVNPELEHHHEQAAYLALFVARQMNLPEDDVVLALYAALLHDIGSIVVDAPQTLAEVERNARAIAEKGSRMFADLPGFEDIANVIGYSQCSWRETIACAIEEGATCERRGRIASIVHLADIVATLLKPGERVLNQAKDITEKVKACSGTLLSPDAVAAFLDVAELEYVWMDLMHNPMFLTYFTGNIATVSLDSAVELTRLMSRIIDFRSPFTAMHSAGVAATAYELSRLAGMGVDDEKQILIAGNLHDVGKLAVPRAILEKPGKLTDAEYNVIKEHPYYTALVLLNLDGFAQVSAWASNHHEKLTGHGYPFHRGAGDLDLGSRIMAVADIFSAIAEERPYRPGMSREKAAAVLQDNAASNAICSDLVALLIDNYEQVDTARDVVSHAAGARYFASIASAV